MKILSVMLSLCLILLGGHAEAAKRMGGGGSFGKQSSNVTQRGANAPAPAPGAVKQAPPPTAPAAQAPKRPWGAMLGGLAAGLGLAYLASALGLGEGMADVLMFGLLALGVMLAFAWFRRRRSNAAATPMASPFAFQGATPGAHQSPSYRPENVGNDASARPFERSGSSFGGLRPASGASESGTGSIIGSALTGSQSWGVPADFDTAGFLSAAKANFVTLQAAWDRSDVGALRVMMTDEMLQEIQAQLAQREGQPGANNLTDVVMLEAQLLGIEDQGHEYLASVEFSGMIREDQAAGPAPFREVWNMIKPKNGRSGWLVAGVQALQ